MCCGCWGIICRRWGSEGVNRVEVNWLKGQKYRGGMVFGVIDEMMSGSAQIASDLLKYNSVIHPLHDTENAAVGLFVAGAVRAGFLPLTEYSVKKRTWQDGRKWTNGRADLWFVARQKAYSFEFKRTQDSTSRSTESELWNKIEWAGRDISRVPKAEYDHAFSGVVAPVWNDDDMMQCRKFSANVDYACVIGHTSSFEAFIFFNQKC